MMKNIFRIGKKIILFIILKEQEIKAFDLQNHVLVNSRLWSSVNIYHRNTYLYMYNIYIKKTKNICIYLYFHTLFAMICTSGDCTCAGNGGVPADRQSDPPAARGGDQTQTWSSFQKERGRRVVSPTATKCCHHGTEHVRITLLQSWLA